jgi:CRP-like cAMP-binding protein
VSLLSGVGAKELADIADRGVREEWPAGAVIIKRGSEGDCFYVLLQGRATVHADDRRVELLAGDSFGEIAVLHGVGRTADVVAATPALTLSLRRDDFMWAVQGTPPPT